MELCKAEGCNLVGGHAGKHRMEKVKKKVLMFKCSCGHEDEDARVEQKCSETGRAWRTSGGGYDYTIKDTVVEESTLYCLGCGEPLTDY
jgi:hypothetical protein